MSKVDQTCLAATPAVATAERPPVALFAIATGVIVTNLFAPQTLIGLIAASLRLPPAAGGVAAMTTLLGYAAGLFLLVPLADLKENRRLVVAMIGCAAASAAAAALAPGGAVLLAALFMLGAASSAIQILVPLAAAMAQPALRGRVIGDVMGGLMIGILLSRPIASAIAGAYDWRAFYGISAVAMAAMAILLAALLPERRPSQSTSYAALIASLWSLLRAEPILRRRALTASLSMAAFSLFWTSVALRLARPPFDLGQSGIALFALVGAGGALATPLAGRAGDRGWTRAATIAAHGAIVAAFALAAWSGSSQTHAVISLMLMAFAAVSLDIGVTADQTLGRRAVNLLRPEARGRLNGLFVGLFFLGGAFGSALIGAAWAHGGWATVCCVGGVFGLLAFGVDMLSQRE